MDDQQLCVCVCVCVCVCAYWWALVGLGRGLLAEESVLGELLLQSHGVDGSLVGARRHRLGLELLTAGRS